MKLLSLIFFLMRLSNITGNDCYFPTDLGMSYQGNVSVTISGAECVPWRSVNKSDDIGRKNLEHNYCRNPDNSSAPWCYSNVSGIVKEYCAIPQCQVECGIEEIACADRSGCIPQSYFCDDIKHCKDGSDEDEFPTDSVDGIICQNIHSKNGKKCFLREDNCCRGRAISICEGGIDECFCSEKTTGTFLPGFIFKRCFRCLTNPREVIPMQNICDSVINCADLTDEDTGVTPTFTCSANGSEDDENIEVTLDQICDKRKNCKDNIDEGNCEGDDVQNYSCQFESKEVSACDAIPQCAFDLHQEECQCKSNPGFCLHVQNSGNNSYFVCPSNGKRINGNRVCDTIPHCPNYEDELECPNRYYCSNGSVLHLPMERKCDLIEDCEDGSDEGKAVCGSALFYCEDDGFLNELQWSQVCDGVQSCASGADECQPHCIKSVFSNVNSLVKDNRILHLIWIICIVALFGNTAVAFTNIRNICHSDRRDDRAKINRSLILSLSFSDLLVGIYVAGICVSSMTFEGQYCLRDPDWRSGHICTFIGVLLTIGSEQSVFNMVLITILRIEITWRPFSKPRKWMYLTLILLTWTVSVVLAILPILDYNKDFFLREVWYGRGQHYSFQVHQSKVDDKIKWLLLAQNNLTESDKSKYGRWLLYSKLLRIVMPNASATRSFGYYSRHAVCLPNLFADSSDESWSYSVILVLINLIAFIFMFIGYITIYRKATETNFARPQAVQKETSEKLQGKLTRILVTDFCCWIPICIMCLLQISGVRIADDVYLPAGLIIIPINSALNPFLYTDIPEMIWKKFGIITQRIHVSFGRTSCFSGNEIHDHQTTESTAHSRS